MGFGGIGVWQLLIILLIVLLVFGTKRVKSLGGDLGGALKSFRKAMDSDEPGSETDQEQPRLEEGKPDAEFEEQKDKSESQ